MCGASVQAASFAGKKPFQMIVVSAGRYSTCTGSETAGGVRIKRNMPECAAQQFLSCCVEALVSSRRGLLALKTQRTCTGRPGTSGAVLKSLPQVATGLHMFAGRRHDMECKFFLDFPLLAAQCCDCLCALTPWSAMGLVFFLKSTHDLAPRWRRADHLCLRLRWRPTVSPQPLDEQELAFWQAYRDLLTTILSNVSGSRDRRRRP